MQKIIIIGGIGSGTVIAQAIKDANLRGYNDLIVEGFFNDRIEPGEMIEGYPVIAKTSQENVQLFFEKGYKYIYTLHKTDGEREFVKLFYDLGLTPEKLVTFTHPTAYIAPDVKIEKGVVIMPYVMISSHATIGLNTLVMSGVTIGHNTNIGIFNHIASQAVVGAHIKTEIGVNIGLNSTILEHILIGKYATLGMGGVLTKNINENEIWVGNPAKFHRFAK